MQQRRTIEGMSVKLSIDSLCNSAHFCVAQVCRGHQPTEPNTLRGRCVWRSGNLYIGTGQTVCLNNPGVSVVLIEVATPASIIIRRPRGRTHNGPAATEEKNRQPRDSSGSRRSGWMLSSRTRTLQATVVPASRQTRAAARSSGRPRASNMPQLGQAARWSPRGPPGRWKRQAAASSGKGKRSRRSSNSWQEGGAARTLAREGGSSVARK